MNVKLQEKFRGCIAGGYIGSAMGAPFVGMHWKEINEKYGVVNWFNEYCTDNKWMRPIGTTEAGVERQKMIAEAIIEKEDRVWVEDVKKAWLKMYNRENMKKVMELFDITLLDIAKTTVPGRDIGKYCDYSAFISFPGSCQPIALINAGNVETSALDVSNVGQLYQVSNSRGIMWAQLVGMAIAEATRPGASVESVIDVILKGPMDKMMKREIPVHIENTKELAPEDLREYFDRFYYGEGIKYVFHSANEIVTKAICIFQTCKDDIKKAIITGVNMGRGCAAIASLAGSLSGALNGIGNLPVEWIETVDDATLKNPYTCSKLSIRETADELYHAFYSKLKKEEKFLTLMDMDEAEV